MNKKGLKNCLGIVSIIGLVLLFLVTFIFSYLPVQKMVVNADKTTFTKELTKNLSTAVTNDKDVKVSNLPKNDKEHLYIISNVLNEPIILDLNYIQKSLGILNSAGNCEVVDYNGKYLHMFIYRSDYKKLYDDNNFFTPMTQGDSGFNMNMAMASNGAKAALEEIVTGRDTKNNVVENIETLGAFKRQTTSDTYVLDLDKLSRFDLSRIDKNFSGELIGGMRAAQGVMFSDWHNDYIPTASTGVDATNGVKEGFNNINDTASFRIGTTNFNDTKYMYLEFEKPEQTVTFSYFNVAGDLAYTNVSVGYGDIFLEAQLPVLNFEVPGAKFKYWDRTLVGTTITSNVIVNAVYDYVKFNVNFLGIDNKICAVQKVGQYENIKDFSLAGYETEENNKKYSHRFIGWTANKGTDLKIDFKTYPVRNDLELYPIYEKSEMGLEDITNNIPKKDVSLTEKFKEFWNVKLPSLKYGIGNWLIKPAIIIISCVVGIVLFPWIIKLIIIIVNSIIQLFKSISFAIKSHKKN